MAQEATLHIKLDRDTDARLRHLAQLRKTSKGQLVRDAISACYQTSLDALPVHQRQAIAAYQGGFISLSRLAASLGMHVLQARSWLEEHGLVQRNVYGDADADHA